MIKLEHCQEYGEVDFGFIPCLALEQVFCFTLRNYLDFFETTFPDAFPAHFIAGLTGVVDYRMAWSSLLDKYSGEFVEDSVVFEGDIPTSAEPENSTLLPFFDLVWKKCGFGQRPEDLR